MNLKRQDVGTRGRLALRALFLAACGIGVFFSGCTPLQRTVDFAASSVEGLAPLPVVFTAVADADAQSFAWDFGDGGTSTDPVALHVYREGGSYTVTLTVVFADGATGRLERRDLIEVASGRAQPGDLYWIDEGGSIWRGARDGSSKQAIIPNVAGGRTLAIDAGKLYWTIDQGNGRIERANLDGTGRQTLVAVYRPRGLAIDARHGKMYWTTYPTPPYTSDPKKARVMRSNLDGTNVEEIYDFSLRLPGQQRCGDAIAVDPIANKLVWVYQLNDVYFFQSSGEECKNELQSARLDASSHGTLRGDFCYIADLVLDVVANAPALHMYWIGEMEYPGTADVLLRANPNAQTEKVLLIGIDGGTSLDIDVAEGTLYWSDRAGIHRANLDGTSPALIFPDVAARSIALGP
jgi:PKD repeat protein